MRAKVPGDDKRTGPRAGGSRVVDKDGNAVSADPKPTKKPKAPKEEPKAEGNE